MDRQLAFNDAVTGLWAQQALSHNGEYSRSCFYRHPAGFKCAVGFLIPDENYDPDIEEKFVGTPEVIEVIDEKYGEIGDDDAEFLGDMQLELHDTMAEWDPEDFRQRVARLATRYKLTAPNLEC